MSKKDFNNFRFDGLEAKDISNKYMTMNRLNSDETKIVVKVGDSHLQKTRYGFALILDTNHVVFVKDWQVDQNYYGNEVLLTKEYFNVKEWGSFDDFGEEPKNYDWNTWVEAAKAQQNAVNSEGERISRVHWSK